MRRRKETPFEFLEPGSLLDRDLELVLVEKAAAGRAGKRAPCYRFEMREAHTGCKMGTIELRVGNMEYLVKYSGHIGYRVAPPFRGKRYAARSCMLLLPLGKRHGINPLWITCNPDNLASRKTCETAGGLLVEIVDLPNDSEQYKKGDRRKCRYRFDL